ncbi:DapH/DapD/GlmU-related protein [Companilactobacillus alimentarius]|nr:DapH/DapD/GlmU-related protein [Companilactobacillus alimentarius]GEO43903.1 nodulation protein L [Companilactobacillus alimentarius]
MKIYDMNSKLYQDGVQESKRSKSLCFKLNQTDPSDIKTRAYLEELFEDRLPDDSNIWTPTQIDRAKPIKIGHNVFINHSLITVALGGIVIDDNVQIAPEVTLLTANHDIEHMNILKTAPIHIKEGAWIGAKAILLPGFTIGEHAIVGAGAIVTKDVEPYNVVGGNPAKVIKKLNK